jgi:hypothetical protein
MTAHEQPPVELHTFHLAVTIHTSAAVTLDEAMRERMADAVWQVLPVAEDGDVVVDLSAR